MSCAPRLRPITVLTVGHVTHDRYGQRIRAGGCAFYAARTVRSLGARSRLMTAIGYDFQRSAELQGLDVHFVSGPCTTTFSNEYTGGTRRSQWVEAVAPIVAPDLLPAVWRQTDVLFVAPTFGEVELKPWLDAVRAPLVGVGLQGFLKQADGRSLSLPRKVVGRVTTVDPALYSRVDVVFVSDEDIEQFADGRLVEALTELVPVVVVTCGAAGSRIFVGGAEERVGIVAAASRDPTGAGDTYAAAFLFGLAQGASAVEAGRLAAAAASIVVEGEGGERLAFVQESYARAERVRAPSPEH